MNTNFTQAFSPYLVALLIAYIGGQFAKMAIDMAQNHRFDWREFFKSGHMPSTHTAAMVAITTVIGFRDGWGSAVFALAAGVTLVVIYDATHVRRSVGEHGLALRKIIDQYNREIRNKTEIGKRLPRIDKPYFAFGHLPVEAAAGGVMGAIIGTLVAFFWR